MTAELTEQDASPADIPRFTDNDLRTAAMVIVRRIAEWEINEEITPDDADQRVRGLLAYRGNALTTEARNDAYEQLRSALMRLEYVRSDMWDPMEGDRDMAEYDADDDAENAIQKLVGPRR